MKETEEQKHESGYDTYRRLNKEAIKRDNRLVAIFGAAGLLAIATVPLWSEPMDTRPRPRPEIKYDPDAASPQQGIFPFVLTIR